MAVGKSEEGRRKSDLKEGHVRAKNECDRTYRVRSIAFVLRVCVSSGLCVRTYSVRLNACVQEYVCVMGRCGQTNASEFECSSVSTFERRVQSNFFFFYKDIYTIK
jgi:hypothetical protein